MEYVLLLLMQFLMQMLLTVGVIVAAGLLLSGVKRLFLRACGSAAYGVERVTGLIGTPVHELSHAFFCLIFGHKITKVVLYSPSSRDGSLGKVSHTYKRKNLWHQLGNFFIGVAPIFGGSGVLILLLLLLSPASFSAFSGRLLATVSDLARGSLWDTLLSFGRMVLSAIAIFFRPENYLSFQWYVFLVLALPILLHMEVSPSDIRSGRIGLAFLSLLLLAVDAVLCAVYPEGLYAVTSAAMSVGAFLSAFLGISVLFGIILLLISALVLLLKRK